MSPSPVWVLMRATSYTHMILVSVVSTLPSAATTETPDERARTRGQQPPLGVVHSLLSLCLPDAYVACPSSGWVFRQSALSLCFTDTSSRILLVFQGHGSSSQPPWLTGNRKGGKDKRALHLPHLSLRLSPGPRNSERALFSPLSFSLILGKRLSA